MTARCIIGNAVGYIAGLIGTAFVALCGVVKDIVKSIFGWVEAFDFWIFFASQLSTPRSNMMGKSILWTIIIDKITIKIDF